jgi:hypothetical protein
MFFISEEKRMEASLKIYLKSKRLFETLFLYLNINYQLFTIKKTSNSLKLINIVFITN